MHTSAEAAGTPWYQPALEYAVAHRIIPENGTVVQQPTGSLSRGTLATMLYQALDGQPASKHGRFQDVPPDSYCYDAVTWITEQGIASGTGKITFSPEGTVTREQLAVFLANAARVMGLSLSPVRTASSFTDAASVSPWARESLEYCWTRGILNGFQDGSFQPQKLTTRCEGVSSLVSEIQLKEGNRTSAAVSISAATQQTAAAQTGQPSQVSAKLIAHKGFSSLAPENTLTAFDLAGQNGFWGAECDVWSTSDGQYVLTHDAGLGRTCGVSEDVRSMTWEQVRDIPIRNGANIESYTGNLQATRIPLLADYLNICSC